MGEDEVGADEVVGVVAVEETIELVGLVELVLDVGELEGVKELEAEVEGDVLETGELDEACETMRGVGEGDSLGDGVVDELPTGGSLPAPTAPSPGDPLPSRRDGALILIMRLRSTWSRR